MNYLKIDHSDVCNGIGLRVVLWLSGCSHHCYNCQNPQTWNEDSGIEFDEHAKKEIFDELSKDYISGITFSGGDPLFKSNLLEVFSLIEEIREKFPSKTIWLYTGYTWEEINRTIVLDDIGSIYVALRYNIISKIDVLVDGEYIDNKRDVTLHWCGSSNQRVIDVQASIKENKIVLYED